MADLIDFLRIIVLVFASFIVLVGTFAGLALMGGLLDFPPILVVVVMLVMFALGLLIIYVVLAPGGFYVHRAIPNPYFKPDSTSKWSPWSGSVDPPSYTTGHSYEEYRRRYLASFPFIYRWEWHTKDEVIPANRLDLPSPFALLAIFLLAIVLGTSMLVFGPIVPALAFAFPATFFAAFLIAFVFPSLIWISFVYRSDMTPEPKRPMLIALTWGMLSTNIALSLESFAPTTSLFILVAVVAPIVEEFAKPLGLLILRNWIRGPMEGLVFGVACGMGFAMMENLLYESVFLLSDFQGDSLPLQWGTNSLARGLLSTIGHALGTGMIGFGYGYYLRQKRLGGPKGERNGALIFPLWVGGAMLLHGVWNATAFIVQTISIWLIFIPIALAIFEVVIIINLVRIARRYQSSSGPGPVKHDHPPDYGIPHFHSPGWFSTKGVKKNDGQKPPGGADLPEMDPEPDLPPYKDPNQTGAEGQRKRE